MEGGAVKHKFKTGPPKQSRNYLSKFDWNGHWALHLNKFVLTALSKMDTTTTY
jgi:hypothetical protein